MNDSPIHPLALKLLSNPKALPTMPEVARELLRSFQDEDLSLKALCSIIAKDPALSAKVLRLANSARFSPAKAVASLTDAAASLGMDALRNLSMAACVVGAFPEVKGLDRKLFWRHNLACASCAQTFARMLDIDDDSAYLSGLMLRSGTMLIAMDAPDALAQAESRHKVPADRFALEAAVLGYTHADASAALARQWRFPESMVDAFCNAADPMEAKKFSRMAAALHMAQAAADAALLGLDATSAAFEAMPELTAHLRLDQDSARKKIAALGPLGSEADALL